MYVIVCYCMYSVIMEYKNLLAFSVEGEPRNNGIYLYSDDKSISIRNSVPLML